MAGQKRTAAQAGISDSSAKAKKQVSSTAAASRPRRTTQANKDDGKAVKDSKAAKPSDTGPKKLPGRPKKQAVQPSTIPGSSKRTKTSIPKAGKASTQVSSKVKVNGHKVAKSAGADAPDDAGGTSKKVAVETPDDGEDDEDEGASYWLLKAEPESRIEKGVDVKFSIDDLAARTEPEPWDGVRNPTARNNMRAMMKGDLAFFYHSNCKTPGIVGVMEIVREHSTDESAFDEKHPYYDAKSSRDKPKWCVVHVKHRMTFSEKISLKEMQKYSKQGGVLESMQVLRMSRLSVSKVSEKEWKFILNELAHVDSASLKTVE